MSSVPLEALLFLPRVRSLTVQGLGESVDEERCDEPREDRIWTTENARDGTSDSRNEQELFSWVDGEFSLIDEWDLGHVWDDSHLAQLFHGLLTSSSALARHQQAVWPSERRSGHPHRDRFPRA